MNASSHRLAFTCFYLCWRSAGGNRWMSSSPVPLIDQEETTQTEETDQTAAETNQVVVVPAPRSGQHDKGYVLLLRAVTVVAAWFVYSHALPYITMDAERFGIYVPRRDWLLVHVVAGTMALLLGPVQLWLGSHGRSPALHRTLGIGYVMSVGAGSVSAYYLAWKTDFGWVFGMGLGGLATAWIVTTGLAVAAICRYKIQQHWEWMVRSYVVSFAFVFFRVLTEVFAVAGVGTTTEQLVAASWLCWAAPLLITETILQGRKILLD
jgi:uncharacterized membrane protein